MATNVTVFTALARKEFADGKRFADFKPTPADIASFTTTIPSSTSVETHTYISNLPRLREFKGYSAATRLVDMTYLVENDTKRIGPVTIKKETLDDDQTGMYLRQIQSLPEQAMKDIRFDMLSHLAAGTSNLCFDGTAFFANSHTFGTGDNLDTYNCASNDGVTHKIIALICDNPVVKPLIMQDREALSGLMTDADTPEAMKKREFEYWADCRYGKGYGYWWDGIHMTITDTPSVAEIYLIVEQIINNFRTFKLPKGRDTDDDLYIHEGWYPKPENFKLLCNLGLAQILNRALSIQQYVASTGNVDNVYQNVAEVIPTSALN